MPINASQSRRHGTRIMNKLLLCKFLLYAKCLSWVGKKTHIVTCVRITFKCINKTTPMHNALHMAKWWKSWNFYRVYIEYVSVCSWSIQLFMQWENMKTNTQCINSYIIAHMWISIQVQCSLSSLSAIRCL